MTTQFEIAASINVAFDLVCLDKDGNELKTIKVQGVIPLKDLEPAKEEDDHDHQ